MAVGIVESSSQQQQRQQEREAQRQLSRQTLVGRLLEASAADLPTFMTDLLTTQAIVVAGTEAAGFLVERTGDGYAFTTIKHIRPDDSPPDMRQAAIAAFQDLVRPCVEQGKDGALRVSPEDEEEPQYCLITLLRNELEIVAASAVICRCRDEERAQQRLASMQLVAGYFDLFMLRRANEQSQVVATSHQDVLQLAATVATGEGFHAAASNLCNELSTRLGASRVSLGWVKGSKIKLQALSHTEQFDKKQELSLAIIKAMEECLDAEEVVQYDPTGEASSNNVTRDAAALSRMEGGTRVVSLPLRRRNEMIGVLTLEFPSSKPATVQETTALAVAADLLAPQLYDRYQNDRYLITKAGVSARHTAALAVGPRHMLAKSILIVTLGLLLFVTLYSPVYHVKAPFQFQPTEQRIVSAPFEGVLKQVYVEPGDEVLEGQVLAEFDTFDRMLERNRAATEQVQALTRATALRNERRPGAIAESRQAEREAEAKAAEVELLDNWIARAQIKAPIAGQVLRGDLKRRERSTIEMGAELFEIAPKQNLRAVVFVNERDVQKVNEGSQGNLATESLPGRRYDFKVTRVIPASQPRDGQNVFQAYAVITHQPDAAWRSGLEGEARIAWQEKPLIWHWTHRLVEWVRIKLWV